jgi:hypothetical protein
MTKFLLPQAFWFRFSVIAPRIDDIPRTGASRLLDLPVSSAIPDIGGLEGKTSWAQVRVGWNPSGLGLMVLADGFSDEQLEAGRPEGFAEVSFWIDTRDTRDISRATRFCHRFTTKLECSGGGPRRNLTAEVTQRPIARAVADAPIYRGDGIKARAELTKSAWALEVFLPAAALHGFDIETNRRLGFAYQVTDRVRDDQFLAVGRDFPLGENPSLWATLELRD